MQYSFINATQPGTKKKSRHDSLPHVFGSQNGLILIANVPSSGLECMDP